MNFTELDCANGVPSFPYFISAIEGNRWFIFIVPAVICSMITWMYIHNVKNLKDNAPKIMRANCISLVSIYPIVSVWSIVAILVPRAYFFIDSIGHVSFMVISYQLYR